MAKTRQTHSIHLRRWRLMTAAISLTTSVWSWSVWSWVEAIEIEPPASSRVVRESKERPDLLDQDSPKGLRVVQLSTDPNWVSHHLYPEAHMFTPDSKRFLFHRMPLQEGEAGAFWLCDIGDRFGLREIIDERGAGQPSVSPDGRWAYYCIFSAEKKVLQLKRVSLETFQRQTLAWITDKIPGAAHSWSSAGRSTSISSDGQRLCTGIVFDTGSVQKPRFGILVIDLETFAAHVAFVGDHEFLNMHLQYCRSRSPGLSHDILVQHNHGAVKDQDGKVTALTSGAGADLHVIRDDGSHCAQTCPWDATA